MIAHLFEEDGRRRIAEYLKSMEHRTHLWLNLMFGIIEWRLGMYARRSDVDSLLSDLPSRASEANEKILNRSADRLQTEALFQIILTATRPLTLDEANVALTVALEKGQIGPLPALASKIQPRESFKNTVKSLCGPLISIYNSKLIIHKTMRDFLMCQKQAGNWQGRFDLTRSHGKMALICLRYLSCFDEQKSALTFWVNYPLAQYSAQFWIDHVKLAETEEQVQEGVLEFFFVQEQAYRAWVKLYDLVSPKIQAATEYAAAPPLYCASVAGVQRIAELLLKRWVDVNAQGGEYGNALQAACFKGNKETAKILLEKGADVNAKGGMYGHALQAASYAGNRVVVELLL